MKNLRFIALFAVFALVVAACGGDSTYDTTATTTPPATATTAAPGDTTATTDTPTAATEAPPEGAVAGEGGELLLLQWQPVTHLNPYTGTGTKDTQAASLVIEPLLEYDSDGNLTPSLVAEGPNYRQRRPVGGPDPAHLQPAAGRHVVGRNPVHFG